MKQNNVYNDEIDLYELFQKLYEQILTIIGITALITTFLVSIEELYNVLANCNQKIEKFYSMNVNYLTKGGH
ncbi:hypothetical protein [Sulfurihydrogenibium sp.]|jgi:LPS O-antigen subunit length determinant protein (WzzB/FepE family)|uniref:hypothetical protein n=1 Tax=Sulfurihydrogenibium sp. TaxID=2053621 RepID=UPI00261C1775|nr:hypothetical protein [Sulfurihydrogenibium sp.]